MGWADEIADGFNELLSDGAGVVVIRKGKEIPAMLGAGITLDHLVDGGETEGLNPSLSILRTELTAKGWKPKQGDTFTIKEVPGTTLKIKSMGFDPKDPCVKLYIEGEEE